MMRMSNILLLLFILPNIIFQVTNSCFLSDKFHMYVVSQLPRKSPPLFLHCASGKDEVGYHTLHKNDTFEWTFCDYPISNITLYFCHFWWGPQQRAFRVFDDDVRGSCLGDECHWAVWADGFYLSGQLSQDTYKKKYYWES
ncbi:hypothetical protein ABFS83_06G189300 [Erythranthe nasuta]